MAARLTEICVDCSDPDRLAEFWSAVLGWPVGERDEDSVELVGPPGWPTLLFIQVPEPKTVKNRLHLDVNATDRDQQEEVDRLLALGATHADVGQGEVSWVVLADPEGNEFCVLRSRVEPLDAPPTS
jgi:catechol 2,3-dioxygenase-like lactoylglutathione lyase family enzyme